MVYILGSSQTAVCSVICFAVGALRGGFDRFRLAVKRIWLDGSPIERLGWVAATPEVNYGRTVENLADQCAGIA